jgi:hypothetical protein
VVLPMVVIGGIEVAIETGRHVAHDREEPVTR